MDNAQEIMAIGSGCLETGRFQKAIEYFTQAIELDPGLSVAWEYRGFTHFRMNNSEKARADLLQAVALDPERHASWDGLGTISFHLQQFQEAEDFFNRAHELQPDSFVYLYNLIRVCNKLKAFDRSIDLCNRILAEEPDHFQILSRRAFAWSGLRQYKNAIADYLRILPRMKKDSNPYATLGFWYSKIFELEKAENNLQVALQFNPTHPYALNNLGHVRFLQKKYPEALKLIHTSLEYDPSNSYAYKNRALVYLETGYRQEALADLLKARQLGYAEDFDSEVEELLKKEFPGV